MPDGSVLHTARNGDIRLTDPSTGVTEIVNTIDVYANSEDGLQTATLDPNFEENGWVYLYYAPRDGGRGLPDDDADRVRAQQPARRRRRFLLGPVEGLQPAHPRQVGRRGAGARPQHRAGHPQGRGPAWPVLPTWVGTSTFGTLARRRLFGWKCACSRHYSKRSVVRQAPPRSGSAGQTRPCGPRGFTRVARAHHKIRRDGLPTVREPPTGVKPVQHLRICGFKHTSCGWRARRRIRLGPTPMPERRQHSGKLNTCRSTHTCGETCGRVAVRARLVLLTHTPTGESSARERTDRRELGACGRASDHPWRDRAGTARVRRPHPPPGCHRRHHPSGCPQRVREGLPGDPARIPITEALGEVVGAPVRFAVTVDPALDHRGLQGGGQLRVVLGHGDALGGRRR
ncbi:PQQ-dependent sugar dehydrogenase [Georgenia sp. SUBG003]|uniref:PQQ-dependent sugar dehydrogenase n=1 Tax=Georgenia sp. SUBG003 TaxID=1497974 RepID=UPI003AB8CA10